MFRLPLNLVKTNTVMEPFFSSLASVSSSHRLVLIYACIHLPIQHKKSFRKYSEVTLLSDSAELGFLASLPFFFHYSISCHFHLLPFPFHQIWLLKLPLSCLSRTELNHFPLFVSLFQIQVCCFYFCCLITALFADIVSLTKTPAEGY